MPAKPWVCIVMGSDSDASVMSQACDALDELGIGYEMKVASAHRSPERTRQVVEESDRDGAMVFIAGAGMAAHLPGVVASFTSKPVIGVPLSGTSLQGLDALLAVVQMPPGIPVATVAIGGARNARNLATQIPPRRESDAPRRLRGNRPLLYARGAAETTRKRRGTRWT